MPSGHGYSYRRVSPEILLRILRKFQSNPLKTYLASDFGNSYLSKVYLRLLIKLGFIEQVKYIRRAEFEVRTNGKGYRLKTK